MTCALAHDFVGFLAVFGRHNIRPPHFASKVSYSASPQTFAECSRGAAAPERGSYLGEGLAPTSWSRFMNLAPVRGSYLESYCGASPANDMRPLQGQKRELMSCGER